MAVRRITRRIWLGGAAALTATACAGNTVAVRVEHAGATPSLEARIASLETELGGRVGFAALDVASGVQVTHRGDERFAMCSTFKASLAALVLRKVDEGVLHLDERIGFGPSDVLDHAPVVKAHLDEGGLTVETLTAAIVEVSDNSAANLLLARVGGPPALTTFFRSLGDQASRLDRNEPMLNTNLPGDPRDTTQPAAMSQTLRRITLDGHVLSDASRGKLLGWLVACETGKKRLRAGLPPGWRAGDKTGTGENGASNDVAIAWPPPGARRAGPLLLASFIDAPSATADRRDQAHAELARWMTATLD